MTLGEMETAEGGREDEHPAAKIAARSQRNALVALAVVSSSDDKS
jgi:hypothetical protein